MILQIFLILLSLGSNAADLASYSVKIEQTALVQSNGNRLILTRGTNLNVQRTSGNVASVRVLDGPYAGQSGSVSTTAIQAGAGAGPRVTTAAPSGNSGGGGGNSSFSSGGSSSLAAPICGCSGCEITSTFGMRRHPIKKRNLMHEGCDIGAPRGTVVRAAADGVVAAAGTNGGYGKMVQIQHGNVRGVGNGANTRYAHLLSISVTRGQQVRKGQEIGKVDSTGQSTGHHLHFEVLKSDGSVVNPQSHVNMTPNAACPGGSGGNSSSVR